MAKVVKEKREPMKDIVNPEVESACAARLLISVILLENSRFHNEEDNKDKDADGNKIKSDPENVKESRASLPRWLTFTAAVPLAPHTVSQSHVGRKCRTTSLKVVDSPTKPVGVIPGEDKVADKIQLIVTCWTKRTL